MGTGRAAGTVPAELLRAEWARLQRAPRLRARPVLVRLLDHLIGALLERDPGRMKETVIAAEVFGRDPAAFDPQRDAIVRVSALRLRKALADHYATDGSGSELVVELRSGSYVPHLRRRAAPPMVTVLPLADLTGHAGGARICSELTLAFADALAEAGRLCRVVDDAAQRRSRRAPASADGGADIVLCGSVAREADCLRVSVRFERAGDRVVVWSCDWLLPAGDEAHAANGIVGAARNAVTGATVLSATAAIGMTVEPHAHGASHARDLVDRSRMLLRGCTREQARHALQLAEHALNADPGCADAHLCAAEALEALRAYEPQGDRQTTPDAVWHTRAALRLQPGSGLAHAQLGLLLMRLRLDWAGATRHFDQALDLAPENPEILALRADYLTACGRFDEAYELLEAAQLRDPINLRIRSGIAMALVCTGTRWFEALEHWRQIAEIEPNDPMASCEMVRALLHLGRSMEAEHALDDLVARHPEHPMTIGARARALVAAGNTEGAHELLRRRADSHPGAIAELQWARHWASAGETTRAFAALERSGRAREPRFCCVAVDPDFALLRNERQWGALLHVFGFPQTLNSAHGEPVAACDRRILMSVARPSVVRRPRRKVHTPQCASRSALPHCLDEVAV